MSFFSVAVNCMLYLPVVLSFEAEDVWPVFPEEPVFPEVPVFPAAEVVFPEDVEEVFPEAEDVFPAAVEVVFPEAAEEAAAAFAASRRDFWVTPVAFAICLS